MSITMLITMMLCFTLTISVAVSIGLAAILGIQIANINMLISVKEMFNSLNKSRFQVRSATRFKDW